MLTIKGGFAQMSFTHANRVIAVLVSAVMLLEAATIPAAGAQTKPSRGTKAALLAPSIGLLDTKSPTQPATDWSKALVDSTVKRNPNAADFGAWGYAKSLYLFGQYLVYKRTGDPRYLEYVKGWIDAHVDDKGNIDREINALDYMLPGNLLLIFYKETKQEKYKLAAQKIRERFNTYPRTSDGGFWHATVASRQWQLWLDGMFMSMPFLVRYGQMFGDSAYANDEAAKQLLIYASHLRDPAKGLLYHAYDESGKQPWANSATHHSAEFWGRAMGWYGMAIVDILEVLPADHPKRGELIAILSKLIADLAKYQDAKTGLWYQVVDKGEVADNWLETSSSSMYTYIISMAVRKGYVDGSYKDIARKGYRGVLTKLTLAEDGLTNLADISEGTNVSDLAYYLARKRNVNDFHGLGAFLIMNELFITSRSSMDLSTSRIARSIKVTVKNPGNQARPAEDVVVSVAEIKRQDPNFNADHVTVVADPSSHDAMVNELPSQVDDLDGDGKPDEIAFQIDLQPRQTRTVTITWGTSSISDYPSHTYAKFAMKYDGMGWESEATAWRLYFDKRNAIDLFGKRKPGLYLETYAAPVYNYQDEAPIGRDIYAVGNALGIGAVGAWVDGKFAKVSDVADRNWRIVSTGPVRAIVEFSYKGWNVGGRSVDLTSRMTQWAGERGFEHQIQVANADGLTLVTGMVRNRGVAQVSPVLNCGVATWGHQVVRPGRNVSELLPDQNLGLAVLTSNPASRCTKEQDADNELVEVPVHNGMARWYVLAAWDQEEKAVKTSDAFAVLVKEQSSRLQQPVLVAIGALGRTSAPGTRASGH
jgi:unsaturated rhamnogalacturonyl hydrolase